MTRPDEKKAIYRQCREHTGLNKRQWGRLFALGNEKNTDQVVGHKENPQRPGPDNTSRGVNMPEALAAQLLSFLSDQGFDVGAIEFDRSGRISAIPKREKNVCNQSKENQLSKKVLLSISCLNEDASNMPKVFALTIDDALRQRIGTLRQLIEQHQLDSIEDKCDEGFWSETFIDSLVAEEHGFDIDVAISEVAKDTQEVDLPRIKVGAYGFYFTSVPADQGESMMLVTSHIPFTELDDPNPYISIN